jgi:hypothetical protein
LAGEITSKPLKNNPRILPYLQIHYGILIPISPYRSTERSRTRTTPQKMPTDHDEIGTFVYARYSVKMRNLKRNLKNEKETWTIHNI